MRLTILMDNQAANNLNSEWGLSFLIEADGQKILLDTGVSGQFLENAARLGFTLTDLDYLVLSHGHWDHTWGLPSLIRYYLTNQIQVTERPRLVAHPLVAAPKFRDNGSELGIWFQETTLTRHFRTELSREPKWLTKNLLFLGEIARKTAFENRKPLGKCEQQGVLIADYLFDDTALAYRTDHGLIIITGCSHCGICNIIEQAREVCGEERIIDVIGGFHLLNPVADQMQATVAYFRDLNPAGLHPCHCTDLQSKIALAQAAPVKEVTVGLQLEYV
jgi:7,8-dihydropterin-6-yl-methyl-4-(beta-D-ribofuranosyl)aminobenzene 5'-phosphate synthase